VSSGNTPGASPGRGPLVIVLAIIGILGIIGGILYVSGAANSIHFIDGSVYKGHHQVRAAVSFIVGIAFLIMAYIAKTRSAGARRPSVTGGTGAAGTAGPTAGTAGPTAGTAGPTAGTAEPTAGSSGTPTTPSGS
jgi:hypothetical protein